MQKPILEIDISGPDGNIFAIVGKVQRILKAQRRIAEFNDLWEEIQKGDYTRALFLINQKVELIDTSKTKMLEKQLKNGKMLYSK